MWVQIVFKVILLVFTISNLAALGLESSVKGSIQTLKSFRFIGLTLLWGWVVGPAVAFLIIKLLPLDEAYGAGLLLVSLAPTAPFFPIVVRKARGDLAFASAYTLLVTVAMVILMPLMAPLVIKGLVVDTVALAQPLVTTILLPLLVGVCIKVYTPKISEKILPAVKKIGGISSLLTAILVLVLYWKEFVSAVGTFAPLAELLFVLLMAVITYKIGFGLKQNERSVMSLGMSTRNIAAVFVAYFGIQNPDPKMFVMILLIFPITLIEGFIAAGMFSKQALKINPAA